MQGRSMRRLLTDLVANGRDSFFYEYFYERSYNIPTVLAVRTPTAKLIKYPGHDEWTELFDLARDPYEMKNLVHDPAAKDLLAKMSGEFDAQVKTTQFQIPDYADKPGEAPAKKGKAK